MILLGELRSSPKDSLYLTTIDNHTTKNTLWFNYRLYVEQFFSSPQKSVDIVWYDFVQFHINDTALKLRIDNIERVVIFYINPFNSLELSFSRG